MSSSSSSSLSYIPMVSSVTDMPLTPYPLEYSLLSTLALSSSSSDENAQDFTLRAPSFRTGVAVPVGVPSKDDAFRTHPMKLLNERNIKGTFFGNYKPKTDIPGVVKKYMNKELELEKFSLTQSAFTFLLTVYPNISNPPPNAAPVFHIERNKPEHVAGMYSAIPYAISQVNHGQYSSSAIS
ncbi:unnamed protein product [Brassica rapa subsp. trilocularis]|uniref:alcohol dehydrogenase n=1 Tax=Brassica campestris TaxID=3711 RepID=M4DTK1_BRACM